MIPTELYKGYVKSRGKKPLDKLKTDTYRTLEECEEFDSFGGVLNDDIIIIDIDESNQAELLHSIIRDLEIDCYIFNTTRGKHFVFKNTDINSNKTATKLACGLTADVKCGSKLVVQPIKIDGEYRDIPWFPYGELSQLPKWLYPIKTDIDLLNLSEGQGRNDVLFNYILTLNRYGLTKNEARETLKIINDYIFMDKLSDSEFETITRDEAFPKHTFMDKQGFHHDTFANFLINEYNIKRINGQLHTYNGQVYVAGTRILESQMIHLIPTIKKTQRNEVLSYIDAVCYKNHPLSSANLIAFKNGIYDLENDELIDFSPEIIITNQIPHDYKTETYDENINIMLDKLSCGDAEIRSLLEECVGYSFYRRSELSKAFIFIGNRANGKSTFLSMLRGLLGDENCSSLDINQLEDRFSTATMASKLANIGDDINDDYFRPSTISVFKKVSSGNVMKAEFKGQDAFDFKPYAKLFFSANNLGNVKDPTGAFMRRIILIPMNNTFTKESPDYDPYFVSKITTESAYEYMIFLAIKGLRRVLENNGFSKCEKADTALENYERENNHVIAWVDEVGYDHLFTDTTKGLFIEFREWCFSEGYKDISLTKFSRDVCVKYCVETKSYTENGKRIRKFCPKK